MSLAEWNTRAVTDRDGKMVEALKRIAERRFLIDDDADERDQMVRVSIDAIRLVEPEYTP